MDTDPRLAVVLEAIRAGLAQQGRQPIFIQILYSDATSQLVPIPSMPAHSSVVKETNVPGTSETEDAVLRVLEKAERPLKGLVIAGRAGISYSSHLRKTLAELVRRGKVIKGPQGGYWQAERELPDEDD